jgi:hypothetical protein
MRHVVRVRFEAPVEQVSRQVGNWATVEPEDGGCVMTMNADTLDWPLMMLAAIDAPFAIEGPDELVALAAATGQRLTESAGGSAGGPASQVTRPG